MVWEEEQKALSERKKRRELQKELEQERSLQELQRLTGKKDQRVEWMYNAPAVGSGPAPEELEQYLLGKKRVDQLFKEQDQQKV